MLDFDLFFQFRYRRLKTVYWYIYAENKQRWIIKTKCINIYIVFKEKNPKVELNIYHIFLL